MKGHRGSGWGPGEHGPGGACPMAGFTASLVGGYCVGTIVLFTQGCMARITTPHLSEEEAEVPRGPVLGPSSGIGSEFGCVRSRIRPQSRGGRGPGRLLGAGGPGPHSHWGAQTLSPPITWPKMPVLNGHHVGHVGASFPGSSLEGSAGRGLAPGSLVLWPTEPPADRQGEGLLQPATGLTLGADMWRCPRRPGHRNGPFM